jgi:hypothetical protein
MYIPDDIGDGHSRHFLPFFPLYLYFFFDNIIFWWILTSHNFDKSDIVWRDCDDWRIYVFYQIIPPRLMMINLYYN